jgi:hypothetical protein
MRKALLIGAFFAVNGCYKTNIENFSDTTGSPGVVNREWQHSLLSGLIPLSEADARATCGDKGVWAISTRANGWNLLVAGLTFGIYSPTTAKITCRS